MQDMKYSNIRYTWRNIMQERQENVVKGSEEIPGWNNGTGNLRNARV